MLRSALLLLVLSACGPGSSDVGPIDSDTDVDPDTDDTDDTDVDTDCATSTFYPDQDGDGYGSTVDAREACSAPTDGLVWLLVAGDCDDNAAAINPDGVEVCDANDVDEDCDGHIDDEDDSVTGKASWYRDADGDGYGDENDANPAQACAWPTPSRVEDHTDCDDSDEAVHPGAGEDITNDIDDDCDGNIQHT